MVNGTSRRKSYRCQRCWGSCSARSSSSWGRWAWPERSPGRWRTGAPSCCCWGVEEKPWSLWYLHCHYWWPQIYSEIGENGLVGLSVSTNVQGNDGKCLRFCSAWWIYTGVAESTLSFCKQGRKTRTCLLNYRKCEKLVLTYTFTMQ